MRGVPYTRRTRLVGEAGVMGSACHRAQVCEEAARERTMSLNLLRHERAARRPGMISAQLLALELSRGQSKRGGGQGRWGDGRFASTAVNHAGSA
jgi:hypothetical protein